MSTTMSSNNLISKTKVVLRFNSFNDKVKHLWYELEESSDVIRYGSLQWQLCLSKLQIDEQYWICIGYKIVPGKYQTINVSPYEAYIVDSDGQPYRPDRPDDQILRRRGFNYSKFVQYSTIMDQLGKYVVNNTLTIVVWIASHMITGPKKSLDLVDIFNNKDLNDCRLVVQQKEFFASKAILSLRSEVFKLMFLSDMSEKASNEVVIDDIDADVFEEFLRYLYFGDSDKLDEMAEQLLYVSDKYMVWDLKTICENLFYSQINTKNAFKVLEVMNKYSNEELKAKTLTFINENTNQCLESDWHKIVGNNSKLITDLVSSTKYKRSVETMYYTYRCGL